MEAPRERVKCRFCDLSVLYIEGLAFKRDMLRHHELIMHLPRHLRFKPDAIKEDWLQRDGLPLPLPNACRYCKFAPDRKSSEEEQQHVVAQHTKSHHMPLDMVFTTAEKQEKWLADYQQDAVIIETEVIRGIPPDSITRVAFLSIDSKGKTRVIEEAPQNDVD